jgi:hypothetical protein
LALSNTISIDKATNHQQDDNKKPLETRKEIKFENLWLFDSFFYLSLHFYLGPAHLIYHIIAAIIILPRLRYTTKARFEQLHKLASEHLELLEVR